MNKKLTPIKKYLQSIALLSENEWQKLVGELSVRQFDQGHIFHSHGDICNEIMFLNSGIARSYLIDCDGRDYTWSFHFNNHDSTIKNIFVTDYASVIKNEKSTLYFESLTEVELVIIPVEIIKQLFESSANWGKIGRIIAEEAYYNTHHRTLSLLSMTATERYQQLISNMSPVLSLIPDFHIASYLGVTPQSLSRIKKSVHVTK